MRKSFWVGLLGLLALVNLASAGVIFETVPFDDSSDLKVNVTIEDEYDDVTNAHIGVSIRAEVVVGADGFIGDITDLFFDYNGAVPGSVNIGFVESNDPDADAADVQYVLSPSLTPNDPFGTFTLGFLLGEQGIGNGKLDVQLFAFTVGSTPVLTAANFTRAAVRVQTVGDPNDPACLDDIEGTECRGGSLKLIDRDGPGEFPDTETQVPEPSTWLMMGAGLGLVTLAKIRRARRS